jgi:hypothetical protein
MFTLASLRSDWWTTCPELVDDFIGIRRQQGLRNKSVGDVLTYGGQKCLLVGPKTR